MEWGNVWRGVIMGISDLIPGVSGGTIAVALGIYDRLLVAISGFFSGEWKRHLGFLLPLAIGMGMALLLLSRVVGYILEHHFVPTQFLFLGLILGVLPMLAKRVGVGGRVRFRHAAAFLAGTVLVASMRFLEIDRAGAPITDLNAANTAMLFLSGWMASMAMLLPGISGSFVLLVIGVYPTAVHALSTMHMPLIVTIGAGVAVGFVISSKAIRHLLDRHSGVTYSGIVGLIVGSTVVVYPGWADLGTMVISAVTFSVGLAFTLWLGSRADVD